MSAPGCPAFAPVETRGDDGTLPYRNLAAAVLVQAVRDLRMGHRTAAQHVLAGGCAPWLELLWLDDETQAAVDERLRALAARLV